MITYGGVRLVEPPEGKLLEVGGPLWQPREATPLNWPATQPPLGVETSWPRTIPGRLYWPRGASRWAVFYGLATAAQLSAIRELAYTAAGALTALELNIQDGQTNHDGTARELAVGMWMLPPRPLDQLGHRGNSELYLLTLVDERYFWWQDSSAVTITGGTTTWAQLFTAIGSALGVTITVTTAVESAYLKPPLLLSQDYPLLPELLDAACHSVGRRFVRQTDGTCLVQTPEESAADETRQDYRLATVSQRVNKTYHTHLRTAGGHFLFDVSEDECDLISSAPESARYVFPGTSSGAPGDDYTLTKTLASLSLAGYAGVAGDNGSVTFRATAVAVNNDGTPDNAAELDSLVAAHAEDFYRWRLAVLDKTYPGALNYACHGNADYVIWDVGLSGYRTRVLCGEGGWAPPLLYHHSSGGALKKCCGPVYTTGTAVIFGKPPSFPPQNVTITTATHNQTVTSPTVHVTATNPTDTITGFVPTDTTPGTTVTVYNTGTVPFTIPHNSSSSTSTNRVITPTGTALTVPPGTSVQITYTGSDWEPILLSGVEPAPVVPTQITSNQSSLNVGTTGKSFAVTSDAAYSIYGIVNGGDYAIRTLINRGTFNLLLPHESSSAGDDSYKWYSPTGSDLTLAPKQAVSYYYDPTLDRNVIIGGTATGLVAAAAGGGAPVWVKVATKTYADFSTAGTSTDIEFYSLPAKQAVHGVLLKHSASFTGGAIGTYTISAGFSSSPNELTDNLDVFAAPANTTAGFKQSRAADALPRVFHFASPTSLRLYAISSGANLNAATAGSVDVWLLLATLP